MSTARWFTLIGLLLTVPATAAKPKKKAPAGEVKKEAPLPPPGDKGTNEGAQGRKNATEDAAREAEPPTYNRRW